MNLSETKFRALVRALLKENESYKDYSTDALAMQMKDAVKDNKSMGTKSVFNLEDNALRTRLVHKNDTSIKLVPKSNDKSTENFREYIKGGNASAIDFARSIDMTKLGKSTNIQRPREKIIAILKYINSAKATASTSTGDVTGTQSQDVKKDAKQKVDQNIPSDTISKVDTEKSKPESKEFKKEPGPNIDVQGLTIKQAINAYLGVKNSNGTYPSEWNEQTEEAWDNFISTDFLKYFKIIDQKYISTSEGYENSDFQKRIKNIINTGYKDFQHEFNSAIEKYKDTTGFEQNGPNGALYVLATIHHYPEVIPDSVHNFIDDSYTYTPAVTADMNLVQKAEEYAKSINGLPARIVYGILSVESGGNPKASAFNSDNFVKFIAEDSGSAVDKIATYNEYKTFVENQSGNKGTGGEIDEQGNFKFIKDVAYYGSHRANSLSKKIQDKALELNFAAAFRATAWGAFQVMGFHLVGAGGDEFARHNYKSYLDKPQEFSNEMLMIYFAKEPKVIDQYIAASNSGNIKDYLKAAKTYYGKADMKYAQGIKANAEAYDRIKAKASK